MTHEQYSSDSSAALHGVPQHRYRRSARFEALHLFPRPTRCLLIPGARPRAKSTELSFPFPSLPFLPIFKFQKKLTTHTPFSHPPHPRSAKRHTTIYTTCARATQQTANPKGKRRSIYYNKNRDLKFFFFLNRSACLWGCVARVWDVCELFLVGDGTGMGWDSSAPAVRCGRVFCLFLGRVLG